MHNICQFSFSHAIVLRFLCSTRVKGCLVTLLRLLPWYPLIFAMYVGGGGGGGGTGVLDPYPRGSTPLPPPSFVSPYPRPLFSSIYSDTPRPKLRFSTAPRPSEPRPFSSKSSWANVDPVRCRGMVSLGHNELTSRYSTEVAVAAMAASEPYLNTVHLSHMLQKCPIDISRSHQTGFEIIPSQRHESQKWQVKCASWVTWDSLHLRSPATPLCHGVKLMSGLTRPTLERRKTLGHLRSINRNMIIHFANQSQTCQLLKI